MVGWIEKMFADEKRTYLVVVIPNGIPLVKFSLTHLQSRKILESTYENTVTSMAPMELAVLQLVDQLQMHFSDHSIQIRYVVIDDLQLGGAPTLRDRMLGSLYGEAAIEEFLSILNAQDVEKRGNLNLWTIDDITSVGWHCYPRQEVTPLFQGTTPRAGGLDPLPFFRQMHGMVSGYRPWAAMV